MLFLFQRVDVFLRCAVNDVDVWKLRFPLLYGLIHHVIIELRLHESKVTTESQEHVIGSLEAELLVNKDLELLDFFWQVIRVTLRYECIDFIFHVVVINPESFWPAVVPSILKK